MKHLSYSIFKNNRLFSFSLMLIYTLVTVVLVSLVMFYPSVEASLDNFLSEYGIADAEIITGGAPEKAARLLEKIDGIASVDAILAVEGKVTLPGDNVVTVRFCSIPQSEKYKYYNTETNGDVILSDESVLVATKFAQSNDISAGTVLTVSVGDRDVCLTVTDLFSCPNTISTGRDANSWFDGAQYGCVYVSGAIMDSLFGSGVSNIIELWFEEGANGEAALESAVAVLEKYGVSVVSALLSKDSDVYCQIDNTLESAGVLVTYMPILICVIGVLFCAFFVNRVIFSSGKTIGILQALGMGTSKICFVFIHYSLLLCTFAQLIGFVLGGAGLYLLVSIYQNMFLFPAIVWSGSPLTLLFIVLAVYAISVLSCVICVGGISGNDPAELFAGSRSAGAPPKLKLLRRLHLGEYTKITVASLVRSKSRLFAMTLCNVACLFLTFFSFSIISSKLAAMDFMFNERCAYDYIVISDDEATLNSVAELSCVDTGEISASAIFDYEGEYMRIEAWGENPTLTKIISPGGVSLSVPESGIIIEEGFARRHGLALGDTVSIGDTALTVAAISREYFNSVQYVSFDTAALLNISGPNVVYVSLKDADSEAELTHTLSRMEGVSCFYSMESRHKTAAETLKAIDMPCYMFAVLGILMGLVIVSNMNIHSINLRKKEFAALKVLGASDREFIKMFLTEIFIQLVLSLAIGLAVSLPAASRLLSLMSSHVMEFVPEHILCTSIASSAAVLIYSLLGLLAAKKTIDKLDLAGILAKR